MERASDKEQFLPFVVLLAIVFELALAQSDKCNVNEHEKLLCGDSDITRADCEAKNCCFEAQQCYYGNAVTVQCTRDGQFVVVVARDVTIPNLALSSVSLLEGSDSYCGPVGTTAAFVTFQFPVDACGTVMKADEGHVVYENVMSAPYEVVAGPSGSITRDSVYKLLLQCRYSGSDIVPLVAEVSTVTPPPPVIAPGPLRVELRLARDSLYRSYYGEDDYPVTKVLREPVYVEVRVLERTDPDIVLTLGDCWATLAPSPDSLPQWTLLIDGCPYMGDNYLTRLVPVDGSSGLSNPTHYKRFILYMFTFVDSDILAHLRDQVFIHCTTAVCHHSAVDTSEERCNRQKRDLGAVQRDSPREMAVVSSGKVILSEPEPPASDIVQTNSEGRAVAMEQDSMDEGAVASWKVTLADPLFPEADFNPHSVSYGLLAVAAMAVTTACAIVLAAMRRSRASTGYDCKL
ncbi:zona pellucida sperm-binding protein 4-like [Megalops cyprinoides]|uniref:zona pellucida sperm-binding protein 4-like n=1 Tax=Megalops cyprinoides TaxID=118141 RepID=UPI001864E222|nr:zona pellucida sperm-binding protein 4-like [Megalops cyprinoides]